MGYASQTDLESRFGAEEILQLSDPAGSGVLDVVVISIALNDAQATVDGYLRAAYSLPLPNVPHELVRVTCDLARFYLYADRVTEVVQKRRDEAISWLKDVAANRTSLALDIALAAPEKVGGVNFVAGSRVFSAANLKDFS
jgi:phage gp36-like protein